MTWMSLSEVPPAPPDPTPTVTPSPVEPTINEIPVRLESSPGDSNQSFDGSIKRDVINRYVVSVGQGSEVQQVYKLAARTDRGTLQVRNSAGEVVSRGDTRWQTTIDDGRRYLIEVLGSEGTNYTLDLRVR